MMSLDLHAATSKLGKFIASGCLPIGTRWKLVGEEKTHLDDGTLSYEFTITYAARLWPRRFNGTLSADKRTFSGRWLCTSNSDRGEFFFKRLTCEAMRFWPRREAFSANAPRALWSFATKAVRDGVRKELFSRSRIEARQSVRQRYLKIIRKGEKVCMDNEEEVAEVVRCYLSMTPSEAKYYRMVYEYRERLAPKHLWALSPYRAVCH